MQTKSGLRVRRVLGLVERAEDGFKLIFSEGELIGVGTLNGFKVCKVRLNDGTTVDVHPRVMLEDTPQNRNVIQSVLSELESLQRQRSSLYSELTRLAVPENRYAFDFTHDEVVADEIRPMETEKLSEETKARLKVAQERLEERGVVDIKFAYAHSFFDPPSTHPSMEQRGVEIAELVEAVLDGKTSPMPPIGDSVRLVNGKMSNQMTNEDWAKLREERNK